MTKSRILFFGKLKTLSPKGEIEVETDSEMTPQALREAVAIVLKERDPLFAGVCELQSSAVADATKILNEKAPIGNGREFSLLPPVCGG